MKGIKFLYILILTTTVITVITGCTSSMAAPAVFGVKIVQQADTRISHILESKNNTQLEKDSEQKGEIVLNEWGYTYSTPENNNINSNIKDKNDIAQSCESRHEGVEEEHSEIILQWNEAQKTLEENKLCWLNNAYLKAYAENISFIISDKDIVMAKYATQASKVEVSVFTVSGSDDEHFEFGRSYTSKLYDIRQIGEGNTNTWQCFSYNSYDGIKCTSAVLADENMVCEISFENCSEQFICDTLAVY